MSVPQPSTTHPMAAPFPEEAQKAIRKLLKSMDNPTAEQFFDYVMTGLPAGSLPSIAARLKISPGFRESRWHGMLWEAPHVLFSACCWDAVVLRRLGEVVALLMNSGAPNARLDSFRALCTATELGLLLERSSYSISTSLLDGRRCLELLALDGASEAELVEILFTPFRALHRRFGYTKLLEMRGLPEVLAAAPERTLDAARALPAASRVRCIKLLQRSTLGTQEVFGRFLVTALLKDPKPVAHAAATALAAMPEARSLLEERMPPDPPPQLRQRSAWMLRPLKILEHARADTCRDGSGYLSITGQWIAIPPPEALPPPDTAPPEDLADALRAVIVEAKNEASRLSDEFSPLHGQRRRQTYDVSFFSAGAVKDVLQVINGELEPTGAPQAVKYMAGVAGQPSHHWSANVLYARKLKLLLSRPGLTLHHLARLFALYLQHRETNVTELLSDVAGPLPSLLRQRALQAGDLRPVLKACEAAGLKADELVEELLEWDGADTRHSRALLWQVIGERLAVIDGAFAGALGKLEQQRMHALELLSVLPAAPARYGPTLLELAARGKSVEAVRARAILSAATDLPDLIAHLLESPVQEQRVAAACWTSERGDPEAIPALRAALAREKAQGARAALLTALTALGDWEHVCGPRQLEEARALVASTETQLGRCLPLHELPPLAWSNGQPVPPELVRWWVLRAAQRQQPYPDPLLQVTFDHLEAGGAAQLAWLALSRFVLLDTRSRHQQLPSTPVTCQQVVERLKNKSRAGYADDALEHRGILALVPWADPTDSAAVVKTFLGLHASRRAQCRALLDALIVNPTPPIVALLEDLADNHRAPRVRTMASERCSLISQRLGWTPQEFSDQAVPSLGLNEHGVLKLPCGDNVYTAEIGPNLEPLLRHPNGNPVGRLGTGGSAADDSKILWRDFRQKLPEIVEMQTKRLRDAMMSGRAWQPAHFVKLLRHPILARLYQLMIFAGINADGTRLTFRPVEAGEYISATYDPVDLSGCCRIRVAHRLFMDEPEVLAWTVHLEDYNIVPLFAQLN